MKATTQTSTEIIRYNIPENRHADFEKAYGEAEAILKSSPYCLGFELLHGEEEPDHYIIIITWSSTEEHLNGFRKSDQFEPFFKLVRPFFENIEEMKHYKKIATRG